MFSLRIKTIASFIEPHDQVIDIGCDHAYLPIYLVKNKLLTHALASDCNQNAYLMAQENVKKYHLTKKITIYLSDGLKQIPQDNIDTIVLAGMGCHTILTILEDIDKFNIKKIIIQSNNNLAYLRKKMAKKKFYLQKEKVIYENKHYYVIGVYTKTYNHLTLLEQQFGLFDPNNHAYYLSLYNTWDHIDKKLSYQDNGFKKLKIKVRKLGLKIFIRRK